MYRIILILSILMGVTGLTAAAMATEDSAALFTHEQRQHWAYQPVQRPSVPQVGDPFWPNTSIDRFILARLEAKGVRPSPGAGRHELLRRATYGLLGLPPTPEQVDEYVNDTRPDAYHRLLDRLLASPRYGEHWSRYWLDLVRYAESDGYKADLVREGAWRYRDYVIRALNADKPYNRFVMEQLAGDELSPADCDAHIATGFLRHWPYEDNGRDLDKQWELILNDVTDVTGQTFLGLTVGCARCHDHKFDAILQADYYRLQAFFSAMIPVEDIPAGSPEEVVAYYDQQRLWEEATRDLRDQIKQVQAPFYSAEQVDRGRQFPDFVQSILATPESERTVYEDQLMILAGQMLRVDSKKMAGRMSDEVRQRWEGLRKKLHKYASMRLGNVPMARGVRDIGPVAPTSYVPDDPMQAEIAPGFLTVMDPAPARIRAPHHDSNTTGRRTALAKWITDPKNPLTARVMVNRIWQQHFGRGVVSTSGDFGEQGARPSHPLLLDWLASDFIERGWSIKSIHRRIMTTAAYQQTSKISPDDSGDPFSTDIRWLWRMIPRRLSAEALRDAMLFAAGRLNERMYGESVRPTLPEGFSERYGWRPTEGVDQQSRRSIYLIAKRNTHLPLLKTFDVPDNHKSCMRRVVTTTPSQALILLNDRWPLQRAQDLAGRLLHAVCSDRNAFIHRAYMIVYTRPPSVEEQKAAVTFLQDQATLASERSRDQDRLALPIWTPEGYDRTEAVALVDFCHGLLNSNEFIYVD